jgi:predicted Rossmann fold nucleotide-binding protein DprA/Smf involved in DNA uptake
MKVKIRRLSPEERRGDLAEVCFVVEAVWEGDELDFFSWARENGQRVFVPTELLSEKRQGARLYGPPRALELRTSPDTVINPFLLKLYVYEDDAAVAAVAARRFQLAVTLAYNERKGADFVQPPWRQEGRARAC